MSNTISAEDIAAIRALHLKASTSFQSGNRASWAALYAEDGMLMPPNAPRVKGRGDILAFGEAFPDLHELVFLDIEIQGEGDVAVATSGVRMTMTGEDGEEVSDTAKQLVVLHRQSDGGWAVTHAMFNSDLPV